MPTLVDRVERCWHSWRDVGQAFVADDLLMCDDMSCDCDVPHAPGREPPH